MTIATATANLFAHVLANLRTRIKPGIEPVVEHDKAREVAVPALGGKYKLRVTPVSMGPGHWSTTVVEILDAATGATLGHYERNYHTLYDTFYPFKQGGREFALYSKDYTATRVMTLPDCQDIAGEGPHGFGFCPTGYYVPQPEDVLECADDKIGNTALDGTFGFICGCVWGDDSSWKIQYLDLSKITEGVLKREARFGYLEMDDSCETLKDAIDVSMYEGPSFSSVKIKTSLQLRLQHTLDVNWPMIAETEYEKQRDAADPSRIEKCANPGCGHLGKNHTARRDGSCWLHGCECKAFKSSGTQATPEEVADE